jgi:hypothetical protein
MSIWIECKYESVGELDLPIALLQPSHEEEGVVQGIFYVIHSRGCEKFGYFKFKRKWYAVDIGPSQIMTLTQLKGVRVKFKHDWADYYKPTHYIKVNRTHTAENITIL